MSSEYDSGCLFCQKEKGIKPLWRAFLHKNWVILPLPLPLTPPRYRYVL